MINCYQDYVFHFWKFMYWCNDKKFVAMKWKAILYSQCIRTLLSGVDNFKVDPMLNQGIIVLTGTETLQLFSRTFAIAKKIGELFAPTLNGITA